MSMPQRCVLLAAAMLPALAAAAGFDGTRPLACTMNDAVDVASSQNVVSGQPARLGVPSALRLDIPGRRVVGPRSVSPIKTIENDPEQILLQGTESGFGWTIVLDRQNGNINVTFADRAHSVVLTGACTPA